MKLISLTYIINLSYHIDNVAKYISIRNIRHLRIKHVNTSECTIQHSKIYNYINFEENY